MSLIDEHVINTLFVSDDIISSGRLGVGTQTPLSALHVVGGTRLNGAVAEGSQTIASGEHSHAEGLFTNALGEYSHAEGGYNSAIGGYSHAEGNHTIALGSISHAAGHRSQAIHNQSWIWYGANQNSPLIPALSTDRVGQFKAIASGGIFLSGSNGVGINTDGIAGMSLTIGGYTQITNAYDGALRLSTPTSPAHNRIGIDFATNNHQTRLWTLIQDPAAAADTNLVIRRLVDIVNQPFVLNLKQNGQHIAGDNWTFQGTVSTVGNINTTGRVGVSASTTGLTIRSADDTQRLFSGSNHNRAEIHFLEKTGTTGLWGLGVDRNQANTTEFQIHDRAGSGGVRFQMLTGVNANCSLIGPWTVNGTLSAVNDISTTGRILSAGVDISSLFGTGGGGGGVTQILAGNNVTISPAGGTGAVTINASDTGVRAITGELTTKVFDMTFDYNEYILAPTPSMVYIGNCTVALPTPVLRGLAHMATGDIDVDIRLIIHQDFGGNDMIYGLDYWLAPGSGPGPDGTITWGPPQWAYHITRGPAGTNVETIMTEWQRFNPVGAVASSLWQFEARRTASGNTCIKKVYMEVRKRN